MTDFAERSLTHDTANEVTGIRLDLTDDTTYEEFRQKARDLRQAKDQFEQAFQWAYGDILVWGQQHFDEDKSLRDAASDLGLEYLTAIGYRWVAKMFPPDRRNPNVAFGAHKVLAGPALSDLERDQWLAKILEEGMSVRALEAALKDKPLAIAEERDHTRIQSLLLNLGSRMHFEVWVAPNDRGLSYGGQRFADIDNVLRELPDNYRSNAQRIVEMIDVVWVKNGYVRAAFEIECTTAVYSGLLRMSDLISLVPTIEIKLFVVAPESRRDKVLREVNRPTFDRLSPALSKLCRLITFETLTAKLDKIGDLAEHFNESLLNDLSEDCALIDHEE